MSTARIIKNRGRILPADAMDERTQARLLRQQAEAELSDVQQQIATARAQGFDEGKAQGLEAGHAEITGLLTAAHVEADRLRTQARDAAIPLARRMAEKIVGHALTTDPTIIADIAAAALANSRAREGQVVLRCHPEDRAALQVQHARLADALGKAATLHLTDDPAIDRGGCVVETPLGRLDARLSSQLAALERALGGARASEAGDS